MPPSRKKHNGSSGGAANANGNNGPDNNDNVGGAVGGGGSGGGGAARRSGNGISSRPMTCSVPTNCTMPEKLIYKEDIATGDIDVVKIVCNNSHCNQDEFMHLECFEAWEKTVLAYLRSSGRSRPWSGKQKQQNIWTKKAYDVVFKACGCKCGSGHIRKDLNWDPPTKTAPIAIPGAEQAEGGEGAAQAPGKKKKKNKTKELPTLAISAPIPHPNNNHQKHSASSSTGGANLSTSSGSSGSGCGEDKIKTTLAASQTPSLGSIGYGSCDSFDLGSLPNSSSSAMSARPRINSLSSNISTSSSSSSVGGSPPPLDSQFSAMTISSRITNAQKFGLGLTAPQQMQLQQQQQFALQQRRRSSNSFNENTNAYGERQRLDSFSNNGLFSIREDLRSLHILPAHKFNRYHIKLHMQPQPYTVVLFYEKSNF